MDAKFFVTFETAKALKEKGYNSLCDCYYEPDKELYLGILVSNRDYEDCGNCSAPTYHEVVDWLEGKGYVIEALNLCRIATGRIEWRGRVTDVENNYEYGDWALTREAALNAAILKALEMKQDIENIKNTLTVGLVLAAASELLIRTSVSTLENAGARFNGEAKRVMTNFIDSTHKVQYWYDRLQEKVIGNDDSSMEVFDNLLYNACRLAQTSSIQNGVAPANHSG